MLNQIRLIFGFIFSTMLGLSKKTKPKDQLDHHGSFP